MRHTGYNFVKADSSGNRSLTNNEIHDGFVKAVTVRVEELLEKLLDKL